MLVFVTGATGRPVDVLRAFGFVRDTAPCRHHRRLGAAHRAWRWPEVISIVRGFLAARLAVADSVLCR
jgi:hypothetical protein